MLYSGLQLLQIVNIFRNIYFYINTGGCQPLATSNLEIITMSAKPKKKIMEKMEKVMRNHGIFCNLKSTNNAVQFIQEIFGTEILSS